MVRVAWLGWKVTDLWPSRLLPTASYMSLTRYLTWVCLVGAGSMRIVNVAVSRSYTRSALAVTVTTGTDCAAAELAVTAAVAVAVRASMAAIAATLLTFMKE